MLRRTAALTFLALLASLLTSPAAEARTPGSFTGYAFDTCHTPSQSEMDVWLERSPYWGVGVYISGSNRACPDEPNLTATWVTSQTGKGWRILPLTVGLQASCFRPKDPDIEHISADEADGYAAAKAQGVAEANTTIAASRALGIAKGSTQWLDIEHFDITKRRCKESALAFIASWTRRLHNLGYKSGFYSSASSGIAILDEARKDGAANLPDQLWIGEWNLVEDTESGYLSDEGWRQQRVHQYRGGHEETYGGVTLNIDSNWMDVGRGSRAPRPSAHCGVPIDFPSYSKLHRGSKGPKVKALQCLLRQQHLFRGSLYERYDRRTARAVKRFQHRNPPLRETGKTNKPTWVALLSSGATPFMKIGSASNGVRRLQRALNAATTSQLEITGVYDKRTARALKRYQRARGLHRTGVTTDEIWALLQDGRR